MSKRIVFQWTYSCSCHWWLNHILEARSTRQCPTLDRMPTYQRFTHIHVHTHSDWDSLNTPINLLCMSLACGRKPVRGKTHLDVGEVANFTQKVALPREHIFSHQRYNKMTIFKNLLYSFSLLECLPYLCMLV